MEEVEEAVVAVEGEAEGGVMEEEGVVVEEGVVLEEEGEVTRERTAEGREVWEVAEATPEEETPTRPRSTALRAVVMVAPGGPATTGRLAEPEGTVAAAPTATGLLDTAQTGEQALIPTHATTRKDILRKC